jgi:hypothetical protein
MITDVAGENSPTSPAGGADDEPAGVLWCTPTNPATAGGADEAPPAGGKLVALPRPCSAESVTPVGLGVDQPTSIACTRAALGQSWPVLVQFMLDSFHAGTLKMF